MAGEFLKSTSKRIDSFAGDGSDGWNTNWGQEVIHKYLLPQVKPGDRVLDLCSGYGRASIPLVLKGAKVVLVDRDQEATDYAQKLLTQAKLTKRLETILNTDATKLDPKEVGRFKFVIACCATTHMIKTKAAEFIGRLPLFLQAGTAYIYVDVPSRSSIEYDLNRNGDYGNRVDLDTYEEWCGCSGVEQMEPVPYFTPGEAEMILKNHNGSILSNKESEATPGNFNREIITRFHKF